MYAEIAWVLVFSGTQVQPQVILDPDYLPDYLSVFYDYGLTTLRSQLKITLKSMNYISRRGLVRLSTSTFTNIILTQ